MRVHFRNERQHFDMFSAPGSNLDGIRWIVIQSSYFMWKLIHKQRPIGIRSDVCTTVGLPDEDLISHVFIAGEVQYIDNEPWGSSRKHCNKGRSRGRITDTWTDPPHTDTLNTAESHNILNGYKEYLNVLGRLCVWSNLCSLMSSFLPCDGLIQERIKVMWMLVALRRLVITKEVSLSRRTFSLVLNIIGFFSWISFTSARTGWSQIFGIVTRTPGSSEVPLSKANFSTSEAFVAVHEPDEII